MALLLQICDKRAKMYWSFALKARLCDKVALILSSVLRNLLIRFQESCKKKFQYGRSFIDGMKFL